MKHNRTTAQHTAVVCVIGAAAWIAAAAHADPVNFIAANVQQSPIFDATAGANGQWTIPGATFFDGTVSAGANLFYIEPSSVSAGGTMVWSGSDLAADLSVANQADGQFAPGGTFSISGTLYDFSFTPLFNGVLLAGAVSGFQVREPDNFPDALDMVIDPLLTPTSGALVDGTYATMNQPYALSLTIVGASQGGADLQNFQTDIESTVAMQFELNGPYVPEPGSVMLTLLGAGLLIHRRR